MKLFKTEEHADIATTLNNMALIKDVLGQNDKALKMNQKVYGKFCVYVFYLFPLLSFQ